MSRPPSQPCPPTPDRRYLDPMRPLSYAKYQGVPASFNQPYPTQEPPRFLFPDSQVYDPTVASMPYGSWFLGKVPNGGADPRYAASGNTGSPVQQGVRRASPLNFQPRAPASVDNSGFPGPYNDSSNPTLGYGRGSVGSGGWSNDMDSQYSSGSVTFSSPVRSDESTMAYAGGKFMTRHQPQKQRGPSECSTAMGLDKILHHSPVSQPPPRRRASTSSRYHLYIRQQPMAARACGAGDRDRRPVDPPPIVQMLLSDFDPGGQSDINILQDPRFTVGCLLFPAVPALWSAPADRDGEKNPRQERRGEENNLPGQSTPLLSGKAFVSPFFVDADPDPSTAPAHPSSSSSSSSSSPSKSVGHKADTKIPATFFIFSDLSIRTAGLYRLQFRLMNWGHVEDTGQSMPILAEAWTEPFRVYPAKDFPGMRDSSPLAEGLKELGFVELKTRGKGKGKGRRRSSIYQ